MNKYKNIDFDVVVVGAGFTGLTAAYLMAKSGLKVCIVDSEDSPGGLAGTFNFSENIKVEKFYHHWFNNDVEIPWIVKEIGMEGDVITLPTQTGMYFNGRIWRLSSPLDLLKFKALSLVDRIKLGLSVLKIRKVKDWKKIENLSIREWLEPICGKNVYKVVWEPLISSKFSIYAESVNAVWMWKKLVLRGSSRNDKGKEELAYFKGGFGRLAEALVSKIEEYGGVVVLGKAVKSVNANQDQITSLQLDDGEITGKQFLFTPSFSIIAQLFDGTANPSWLKQLRRVNYLGNMCLVLRLKHSLSSTYWLNVNDPGFPFVGVIEHTNFDLPENYKNSHIVFLSRYMPVSDPVWNYGEEEYLNFALESLQRMFPKMDRSWIIEYKVWRAEFAQPIVERNYSEYVPGRTTPYKNGFISTMAQIYPEDRGTNYAIREGREVVEEIKKNIVK